jgi:hypothetical protein
MVGLASAQPSAPVEGYGELRVRIPFAKIIKAEHIAALLTGQQRKDKGAEPFAGSQKEIEK